MKHSFTLISTLLLGMVFTLTSCQNEVKNATGDYSYKTSGAITLSGADTTETFLLNNEIGTLTIMDKNDNDKGIILSFNGSYGPVYTTTGRIVGNRVIVDEYSRQMEFKELEPHILKEDLIKRTTFSDIRVTGSGTIYDETILFTWTFTGVSTNGEVKLNGNNITTVATHK